MINHVLGTAFLLPYAASLMVRQLLTRDMQADLWYGFGNPDRKKLSNVW